MGNDPTYPSHYALSGRAITSHSGSAISTRTEAPREGTARGDRNDEDDLSSPLAAPLAAPTGLTNGPSLIATPGCLAGQIQPKKETYLN